MTLSTEFFEKTRTKGFHNPRPSNNLAAGNSLVRAINFRIWASEELKTVNPKSIVSLIMIQLLQQINIFPTLQYLIKGLDIRLNYEFHMETFPSLVYLKFMHSHYRCRKNKIQYSYV